MRSKIKSRSTTSTTKKLNNSFRLGPVCLSRNRKTVWCSRRWTTCRKTQRSTNKWEEWWSTRRRRRSRLLFPTDLPWSINRSKAPINSSRRTRESRKPWQKKYKRPSSSTTKWPRKCRAVSDTHSYVPVYQTIQALIPSFQKMRFVIFKSIEWWLNRNKS